MYFLLAACEHPAVLRTIYFGTIIRDIAFTIIPIGIVLMTIIDFSKAVIAGKDDEQQKAIKLIPKRIMYAIIVFAIPWIVYILMNTLSNLKINVAMDYTTCINNAESGAETGFSYYDSLLEAEETREEAERRKIDSLNRVSGGNSETMKGAAANKMAKEMLEIASSQVGNTKSSDYGAREGAPWCASFATWVMEHTIVDGVNLYKDIVQKEIPDPNSAGAACTMNSFRNTSNLNFYYSNYYTNSKGNGTKYNPKAGDIIYFDWNGDWNGVISNTCSPGLTWADHIGIVEYYENGVVHTIEGNSNNRVQRMKYSLNSKSIIGYGSWYS